MKNIFFFFALLFSTSLLNAQPGNNVTVQDDAKVGLIVTGTGNTINTIQIFGKSPEYAELKKTQATCEADIQKKADQCEQMAKDSLPAKYRDGCRTELINLNARRDSVQNIETRFRADVIRLAESFSKTALNSERLRMAKLLFDEGKIREADAVLNTREMKIEGDLLLAEKARAQEKLQVADSLLRIKADEFALKAQLKATDYGDSLRYDSAEWYFRLSLKYSESGDDLWHFAEMLFLENQISRSLKYYERGLLVAQSKPEKGEFYNALGIAYMGIHDYTKAKSFYEAALKIRQKLAKKDSTYLPSLAQTHMNMGSYYRLIGDYVKAEKMYKYSLAVRENLGDQKKSYSFDRALTYGHLGGLYRVMGKLSEAKNMDEKALEIFTYLAESNFTEFGGHLGSAQMNFGVYYEEINPLKSEEFYKLALQTYKKLNKPSQIEGDIALTTINYANLYLRMQQISEAGRMYSEAIEILNKLVKNNPLQYELDLAHAYGNFSYYCIFAQKYEEAESAALYALAIDTSQNYIRTNLGHSYLFRGDWDKAKATYAEYIKNEPEPTTAKADILKDLDDLEAVGVTCPEVARTRAWLKA